MTDQPVTFYRYGDCAVCGGHFVLLDNNTVVRPHAVEGGTRCAGGRQAPAPEKHVCEHGVNRYYVDCGACGDYAAPDPSMVEAQVAAEAAAEGDD